MSKERIKIWECGEPMRHPQYRMACYQYPCGLWLPLPWWEATQQFLISTLNSVHIRHHELGHNDQLNLVITREHDLDTRLESWDFSCGCSPPAAAYVTATDKYISHNFQHTKGRSNGSTE